MTSTKDQLQILLNLYHNPEKDFYESMEQFLLKGIHLKFKGPRLKNEKLWDSIQWLEFCELHLKDHLYFISSSGEYIDLGYKFLICNDEQISIKITSNQSKQHYDFIIDLKEYSSYLNGHSTLKKNIEFDKEQEYTIELKVLKFNDMRNLAKEYYLADNPKFIQESIEQVLNNLKHQIKTIDLINAKKYSVLKERLSFWGITANNVTLKELIKKVNILEPTDFGIKNTIELYMFCHFFYYYNLNNKKFLKQVKTTLTNRQIMQKKLLMEHDNDRKGN